uniref:(California timema) hypothetical protein n=2 Tax=Timema californicum TaxID=61474 RepID=A0A7R9P5B8_TIMCA|nr:unnamed protein product [Timema californicum]
MSVFDFRSNVTSDKLCQLFEGQLFKYTNVMKGWQYRWFVLVPEAGVLSYYLNETERMQRPRGSVHLAAAVISPSDEDSNTFTVNSATGEMFKLRASDARARHEWVSRIRAITEMHTMAIAHSNPPLSPRKHHSISVSPAAPSVSSYCSLALLDAFTTVQDHLHQAEASYFQVCRIAETLPSFGIYTSQKF